MNVDNLTNEVAEYFHRIGGINSVSRVYSIGFEIILPDGEIISADLYNGLKDIDALYNIDTALENAEKTIKLDAEEYIEFTLEGTVTPTDTTTFLGRTNTEEDKIDVTLQTMEAEHNHSERVSAAVHHHSEDVMPENMLGNIEDLMVKGYDGNLCFERDFLGEAMDMISRFTVPSDVPDFSKNDVA